MTDRNPKSSGKRPGKPAPKSRLRGKTGIKPDRQRSGDGQRSGDYQQSGDERRSGGSQRSTGPFEPFTRLHHGPLATPGRSGSARIFCALQTPNGRAAFEQKPDLFAPIVRCARLVRFKNPAVLVVITHIRAISYGRDGIRTRWRDLASRGLAWFESRARLLLTSVRRRRAWRDSNPRSEG